MPEINPDTTADALLGRGIISSPNCSTMALVMALHPLQREAALEEVVVSTYQSVSGTGNAAVDELESQSHALLHRTEPAAADRLSPPDRLQRAPPRRDLQRAATATPPRSAR